MLAETWSWVCAHVTFTSEPRQCRSSGQAYGRLLCVRASGLCSQNDRNVSLKSGQSPPSGSPADLVWSSLPGLRICWGSLAFPDPIFYLIQLLCPAQAIVLSDRSAVFTLVCSVRGSLVNILQHFPLMGEGYTIIFCCFSAQPDDSGESLHPPRLGWPGYCHINHHTSIHHCLLLGTPQTWVEQQDSAGVKRNALCV